MLIQFNIINYYPHHLVILFSHCSLIHIYINSFICFYLLDSIIIDINIDSRETANKIQNHEHIRQIPKYDETLFLILHMQHRHAHHPINIGIRPCALTHMHHCRIVSSIQYVACEYKRLFGRNINELRTMVKKKPSMKQIPLKCNHGKGM